MKQYGISSIGIKFPEYAFKLSDLAKLRNVDEQKYLSGIGGKSFGISFCPEKDIIYFAREAAIRAIDRWGGNKSDIGLIIFATESSIDMSKPMSSFVQEELNLSGNIRSYEVKHACLAGSIAVRSAIEWHMSGASKGKVALVIASDIAIYAPNHPGEATQGGCAIAMIIGDPKIAEISIDNYSWSEPSYDFYRPVLNNTPIVNGKLSIECYMKAFEKCFKLMCKDLNPIALLDSFFAIALHAPFPKIVYKALIKLFESLNLNHTIAHNIYAIKVLPYLEWNLEVGNSYTASLWLTVSNILTKAKNSNKILAFSYGSGFGADLFVLNATTNDGAWINDITSDLQSRKFISIDEYVKLRKQLAHD